MKYKIVEKFVSVQGEGFWAGTPMAFIRLAQCPVGKVHGLCHSWDGTEFICDTGQSYGDKFRPSSTEWHPYTEVREELDATEILDWVRDNHMTRLLITGGEPLIYDIFPLWKAANGQVSLHIETSGTVRSVSNIRNIYPLWITVSPKQDYVSEMLSMASELKVLVHAGTDFDYVDSTFGRSPSRWHFVQPIEDPNPYHTQNNTKAALDFVLNHPNWRLSLQVHKLLQVR